MVSTPVLRRVASATVLGIVVALIPSVVSAQPAQSVGDLKAKASQIAAQMDSLEAKASDLDEKYLQSQIEVQDLKAKLAANQTDVDAARASLVTNQGQAKQYAIDAYISGEPVDPVLMPATDTADASHRKIFLTQLQGDKQQVIEEVAAAKQNLADKTASLSALKSKADAQSAQLAATKATLEKTIADQTKLQQSVNGDLAAAVAAEQARVEAQRQADAERAARDQAARDSAAAADRAKAAAAAANDSNANSESDLAAAGDPTGGSNDGGIAFPDPGPVPAGIQTVLDAARSQLGVPYVWGASSPGHGFDCSGLVLYAYSTIGIGLPHSSRAMRGMTQPISASQAQPGDLVFYGSPVHHVAIYLGGGMIIHAPHSGDVVKVSGVYSVGSPSFGRL